MAHASDCICSSCERSKRSWAHRYPEQLRAMRAGKPVPAAELVNAGHWLGPFTLGTWRKLADFRAASERMLEAMLVLKADLQPGKKIDVALLAAMPAVEQMLREDLARLNLLPWPRKLDP